MTKQSRFAQLNITEFSKEGLGKGDWVTGTGVLHPVEVPFSMPGDEVNVRLMKKTRGIYQSEPVDWIQFSTDRVKPQCQHFGKCGGCRWQHIAYEDQLKQKEALIKGYFSPFLQENTAWHPIIPCQSPWEYRNKMELSFSADKAGNRYLGLILYGTRGYVFQMQECRLMSEWVSKAVKSVSQWWEASGLEAYHMGKNKGSLRTLTLRQGQRTGDRMVILTVSGNPDFALNKKQLDHFVAALRESIEPSILDQKLSIFLRIQQIAKGQATQFYEMLLYGPDHIREILHIETEKNQSDLLNFRISPTAFFQPNTLQAEKLYSEAIQLTQAPSGSIIYDLYCGTGTLGICMAKKAKKVVGIEINPESSLDAVENVKKNHLSHVSILTGDVGHLLGPLLQDPGLRPDVVLVDPPRAGLDDRAIGHLIRIKAPILTYISCNPATQAKNLAILLKEGYHLRAVQPVDQFPHTLHVENIAVLTRS
ncbi:MAG: 23S rRNA (uracil(1939)-C(5))-methyltransferase RlmD [Parachlamydiaceae bacterium]